jgi:Na+/H+-dicarboxylate symporter
MTPLKHTGKTLVELNSYLQHLLKAKLWIKVLVAIALGTIAGLILAPDTNWVPVSISQPLSSWLGLPGVLFLKMVQMIMIPLILSSIIVGIVNAGSEQLKQLGLKLGIYFIITTLIAVTIGVVLTLIIEPGLYMLNEQTTTLAVSFAASGDIGETDLISNLPKTIGNLLPNNPLASMVSGEMLAVVLFSIIIGLAVMQLNKEAGRSVLRLLSAIQEICMTIVKWAMKLVPYAVFGLIAQLVSNIGLSSLQGIGLYVVTVLIGLILMVGVYMVLIVIFGKSNPFRFMGKIKEVLLLAFSTTSSAAVMPLSIKTAQEKLGISKGISNFLIPVGATINMDGTALYQCVSIIFISQAYGIEMGIVSIIVLMFTIIAASIGTPSIPGGGVVILASVMEGAGIPSEGIVMIIGVERILGMFRTAVNVTGDLTACVVFENLVNSPGETKVEQLQNS